ncbi:hypothetical protein T4B_3792 [Trichinella pseudospiralis]|uniref:Uncharacterized protein n=1 Tax=Trichinella pseudospiralis TaxID=6337 RepID=A0A0V1GIM0_TRIPS|nr:hypothetical protein T4B_3792 [Trichinella pseudospiralis]
MVFWKNLPHNIKAGICSLDLKFYSESINTHFVHF